MRYFAMFLAAAAVSAAGQQGSPVNRPWPPEVQKVSNESPPLTPEQALETFFMPPGYRVELVASEPLVQDPVAMEFDPEGRLWVVEMPGWMPDIKATGEHEPMGKVVVLEDVNRDGRMDKRTIFADGLVLARSLKILDRGILVGEPPNIWLLQDTNGDLRADKKDLVSNQYGHRDIDPQNNANGFHWSIDNRMYTAGQSDIQLQLKNGVFEVQKTLRRGEWGVSHDDAGRIYRNTNESALHVDFVQTAYYARNPNLLRTRGSYDRLATGNEDLNIVWPVRPNPGTNRAYQAGIDRPDGTLAKFTSVCAPLVYRGDRLPPELYGSVFVAEPAANLVSRLIVEDDGTTLWARKAYEKGEFLASTDERFRPVFITNAPDGTLYIADMYRGIIEHRISITEYLRDQIVARKLDVPVGMGRIYRVVHETTKRDRSTALKGSPAAIAGMLEHPNGWWRDTSQRVIVERRLKSVVPTLARMATAAQLARSRIHALWTLDGLDAIQPELVARSLTDPARDVRVSAIRIAERWLAEPGHMMHAAVLKSIDDGDWWVRQQVAASIGFLPAGPRETAAVSLLARSDDPVVIDAALSGLRGSEVAVLEKLLAAKPKAMDAVTVLAATIVRSAQDSAVQTLLAWIADGSRPEPDRASLLRGVEVALLGAPMPARPFTLRANTSISKPAGSAPCPTCPGGRGGPGGAYAFERPQAPPRATNRGGTPRVRLNREPDAFAALAAGGPLASRVTAVLARVTWPGKPGVETVPALTADEQKRYDEGQAVYRNFCQSCHQPDGRGQDRLAPTLVESPFALAAPEVPVRILLHGKEGPVGLMPPIGATLTDDQVAGVLTYIRREWGQTGSPVDPAVVKATRANAASRTRPWTEGELRALMDGK